MVTSSGKFRTMWRTVLATISRGSNRRARCLVRARERNLNRLLLLFVGLCSHLLVASLCDSFSPSSLSEHLCGYVYLWLCPTRAMYTWTTELSLYFSLSRSIVRDRTTNISNRIGPASDVIAWTTYLVDDCRKHAVLAPIYPPTAISGKFKHAARLGFFRATVNRMLLLLPAG